MHRRDIGWIASLMCASMLLALPRAAAADQLPPLAWSAPAVVDALPPYSQPGFLGEVSCPSTSFCAIAAGSAIYTASDPLGGFGAWHRTALDPTLTVSGISCTTPGACVAVGGDDVLTSTDPTGGASRWLTTTFGHNAFNALSFATCPSTALCLLGGANGNLLTSTDSLGWPPSWSSERVGRNITSVDCFSTALCGGTSEGALAVTGDPLASVWGGPPLRTVVTGFACASPSSCTTASDRGEIVTATDPLQGPWTVTTLDPSGPLRDLACGPPSLCLASSGSRIYSSTDPTGGASAWSSVVVSGHGTPLDGSCPSEQLCVLTTDDGSVLASTDPAGPADTWHGTQITGTDALLRVACPLASLCVAFDSVGRVTTSQVVADGHSSWSTPAVVDASSTVGGLACPSATLCVGGEADGSVVTTTDPAGGARTWTRAAAVAPDAVVGIACPSDSLCVAVDAAGNAVTSSDPTAGSAAWHAAQIDQSPLVALTCPTSGLCLAADTAGNLLTSTDPTGGKTAWQSGKLGGINQLRSISCPSASLCTAVGGDAVAMTTQPAGGAGTWSSTVLDDVAPLGDVACATPQLCVAVDGVGNVLVGSSPPAVTPAPPAVDLPPADTTPPPSEPTAAQVSALLRAALGRLGHGVTIRALLRRGGCSLRLGSPANGVAVVRLWSVPRGAHRSLLVASGSYTFGEPGRGTLPLRLTRGGRRLLSGHARIALTATASFTGAMHASARARLTLRR